VLIYSWYRIYRKLSFNSFDKIPWESKNKKRIYLDDNHSLSFSLEDAFGEFEYDQEYLQSYYQDEGAIKMPPIPKKFKEVKDPEEEKRSKAQILRQKLMQKKHKKAEGKADSEDEAEKKIMAGYVDQNEKSLVRKQKRKKQVD